MSQEEKTPSAEEIQQDVSEKEAPGDENNASVGKVATAATVATTAAQATGTAATTTAFALWLQSLLAALSSVVQAVTSALMGFVMGIVNGIVAIAGGIATTLGVSMGVAVTMSVGFIAGCILIVAAVVVSTVSTSDIQRTDVPVMADCEVDVAKAAAGQAPADVSAQTLANAQLSYSVFKQLGLPDENIAGVLGNWSKESGIDPTGVEGIYNERLHMGARKTAALSDLDHYTRNVINKTSSSYRASDGLYYCGLGLGQWTAGRGKKLLDYASNMGKDWYTMDVQLAFMLSPHDEGGFFTSWEPEPNPRSAAYTFRTKWERINDDSAIAREDEAEKWFVMMGEWAVDAAYGNSIIEMSGVTMGEARLNSIGRALFNCVKAKTYDNSSIANAAVSFAYATEDEGNGNNGTALYQKVVNGIGGNPHYMACDRTAVGAIKWAGADDNVPFRCVEMLKYFISATDKWDEIPWGHNKDNLLPGDILIRLYEGKEASGHVVIYVGNEAIKNKYPDAPDDYCIVSASLNDRSAGCGPWKSGYEDPSYRVFRSKYREPDSKYKNIVSDYNQTS